MSTRITIIGAGPGGYSAALQAARAGAAVTLLERSEVGGTCLNLGCIPSKTMKHTADLLARGRTSQALGIVGGEQLELDLPRLQERMATVIASQRQGLSNLLRAAKIDYRQGAATIIRPGLCCLTGADGRQAELPWDKLILATGSEPLPLPGYPFNQRTILSSTDLLHLPRLPRRLAIVGGGAIGCEFASIMANLGCAVTLVEGGDRLLPLPGIDREGVTTLTREFKKRGIRVEVKARVEKIEENDSGVLLSLAAAPPIEAEMVLVAIGRQPATPELGLARLELATDRHGWLQADEFLQTNHPDVFAIGDLLGPNRIMLAHVAAREGEVAADNALGGRRRMDYQAVPLAIYTDPEMASVGLSEEEARSQGLEISCRQLLYRSNGKAQAINEIAGQAKIIASRTNGRLLGLHLIGAQATDLIAEGVLALHHGVTLAELAATIHAHPTLAEVIGAAAQIRDDKP